MSIKNINNLKFFELKALVIIHIEITHLITNAYVHQSLLILCVVHLILVSHTNVKMEQHAYSMLRNNPIANVVAISMENVASSKIQHANQIRAKTEAFA